MRFNLIDPDQYTIDNRSPHNEYRQFFHVEPRTGLLNDPHGLISFGGRYHLFYQTHPFAARHDVKYWFHLLSEDLVNWREEGFALKPEFWYEADGCCSGSTIEKDGRLYAFYTGKVLDSERTEPAEQYQAMAVSDDGFCFCKQPQSVIPPLEGDFSPHFRDPKVWEHAGKYYMIVAAQTAKRLPQIVGYKSADLWNWEPLGVLGGLDYRYGFMWECPGFAEINGHDVLFVCPQGVTAWHNPHANMHESGCVIGKLDYDTFTFRQDAYQKLDDGFEYYAAYAYNAPDGRVICIAWLGLPGEYISPTSQYGYVHCLSVASELFLKNGRICRRPVGELDAYFSTPVPVAEKGDGCAFESSAFRLRYKLDAPLERDVKLLLRCDAEGNGLEIRLDPVRGRIIVDRGGTDNRYASRREIMMSFAEGIELDLLLDVSSFELFINGGEHVMSGRYYVKGSSTENKILQNGSNGQLSVMQFDKPLPLDKGTRR